MTYYLEKSEWYQMQNVPEGMVLDMINMEDRVEKVLYPAIETVAKNSIVLDAGCGTGLLGIYALAQGAKFVYFLEQNSQMYHILENVLPSKLPPNSYKLIRKDIEHLTIEDFDQGAPDYVTSEFYGPTLFDEGYVHYTRHLRSLFENVKFIPECFETKIYKANVDYSQCLWPMHKEVIDHYKFMYSSKGFNSANCGFFDPIKPEYVGSIKFNANTQVFERSLSIDFENEKEKIIFCHNTVNSHGREQYFNFYGWYVPKTKSKKTYTVYISLDEETIFRPMIKEELT
jgi:SAM-dependent methyltransferase